MHFCGKCGKQSYKITPSDWNLEYYKFMEVCQSCGHKVYINGLGKCEECDMGMIPVRTKSSNGYQTVHIKKNLEEYKKKLTDKSFSSVAIFDGFFGITKL